MRRSLLLLLVCALGLTLFACSDIKLTDPNEKVQEGNTVIMQTPSGEKTNQTDAGQENKSEQQIQTLPEDEKKQDQPTERGYGAKEFSVGEKSFDATGTVEDFLNVGFRIKIKSAEKIGAWRQAVLILSAEAFGTDAFVRITALNASDQLQSIEKCRAYHIEMDVFPGLYLDGQELYYAEDYSYQNEYAEDYVSGDSSGNGYYGQPLDHLKLLSGAQPNRIDRIEQYYLEDVFGKTTASKYTQLALELVKKDLDIKPYLNSKGVNEKYTPIGKELSFQMDGVSVRFGSNGDTLNQLTQKGVVFSKMNNKNYKPNEYKLYGATFKGKTISMVSACNYTKGEIAEKEMRLAHICLESSKYSSSKEYVYPDFNVFGITPGAKLKTILEQLGMPKSVQGTEQQIDLQYQVLDQDGNVHNVWFGINSGSKELIDITIIKEDIPMQ